MTPKGLGFSFLFIRTEQNRKEKRRSDKKRTEQNRQDRKRKDKKTKEKKHLHFFGKNDEKASVMPGCPGVHMISSQVHTSYKLFTRLNNADSYIPSHGRPASL